MNKKNYFNVEIYTTEANNEVRNAAFAKDINREVNLANAKKILEEIKKWGYRKAELIHVLPGESAVINGDITLVDINDNPIAKEDASKYYLVIDGQHRIVATALYNGEEGTTPIQVPAIIVELRREETIAQYLSSINVTKNEWKSLDYVRGAANVKQTHLLQRYMELIKSQKNPDGFSLSTLNLIFCGNSKAITKTELDLLCHGKETKGVKNSKPVIPSHNIARGNRFINRCTELGFAKKDMAKRYLAEQFNAVLFEKGEEQAFKLFDSITPNDRKAMYNEKDNLVEYKVIDQFAMIKSRMAN